MACELVTSGWYASNGARSYHTQGDELIRGVGFRPLWWRSVDTFLRPEHVLIVDSASPVKADDASLTTTSVRRLELLMNPGHSQNCVHHYCGAMAAIILGLEYALHNDVDMMIYLEQDALVYGEDIVDRIKGALRRHDLVFGAGQPEIQQSLFAARKPGIRRFLGALHAIRFSDKQVSPEQKFMFAASRGLPSWAILPAVHSDNPRIKGAGLKVFSTLCALARNHAFLPFGYGRTRPMDFTDEVFYFQHGTSDEVASYRRRTGF
ncbi:MAG TPA: hypothetical protein VKT22_15815 [Steroidobacteraceae bacterium]|nr:hypothetical protein [Steroidobacteraceae bacterium]